MLLTDSVNIGDLLTGLSLVLWVEVTDRLEAALSGLLRQGTLRRQVVVSWTSKQDEELITCSTIFSSTEGDKIMTCHIIFLGIKF